MSETTLLPLPHFILQLLTGVVREWGSLYHIGCKRSILGQIYFHPLHFSALCLLTIEIDRAHPLGTLFLLSVCE